MAIPTGENTKMTDVAWTHHLLSGQDELLDERHAMLKLCTVLGMRGSSELHIAMQYEQQQ